MTRLSSAVVALALWVCLPAAAVEVSLDLLPASPGVRCEIRLLSKLVVVDGARTSVRIDLPALPAEIVPEPTGCWVPVIAVPADPIAAVAVQVWPDAAVIGGIAFQNKGETARTIAGTFVDAARDTGAERVACEITKDLWRCNVPAGRPLHLQVTIDDFAPVFVWDVDAGPRTMYDSGIHTLVRGAVVTGRAMTDRGEPVAQARVRILPLASGHLPPVDRAAKLRETRTNANGHFQLSGLEPGIYRVVSEAKGLGDAMIESIELRMGESFRLREPLVHAELSELVVLLTPPVSPLQTPWSVELLRAGDRDMTRVAVAKGTASADGQWTQSGLQPMTYELRVVAPNGSTVVTREVVLHGGREQIGIDISLIHLTGKVLVGDRGVAASLIFESNDRRTVKANSDEDGSFTAEFPTAGTWRVKASVGRTHLRLDAVEISDPPKDLVLRIPGGGVAGKVLDANGRSVSNAIVSLKGTASYSSTSSGENGTFRLIGVEAGAYLIEAEWGEDFVAGPLPVSIAEDEVADVDLRLESLKEVTGVVTTALGAAASGAVVRTFDPLTGFIEDTFADARGMFSFKVKPRSPAIDLVVLAPPAPVAVRRIVAGSGRIPSVNVQLSPVGTRLRLYIPQSPPWPTLVGPDGVARSLALFLMPLFERRAWREFVDGGFNVFIEPGPYQICYGGVPCRDLLLAAHAETVVDLGAPLRNSP